MYSQLKDGTDSQKSDKTIIIIYTFSIKFSFSSIGKNKSKLQKKISKLLILTEMAADKNNNFLPFYSISLCLNFGVI